MVGCVLSGRVVFGIADSEVELNAGNMFAVPKGVLLSWRLEILNDV